MVTEDYGKRAYVKLNSLEKRIEKLENFAIESVYSEIFYNLAGAESSNAFNKKFKVNALKDGLYTFSGNFQADLTSLLAIVGEIYVNGVMAFTFKNAMLDNNSFSFDAPLIKGVNEISVKINSSLIFTIKTLNFKVCGTVSYVNFVNSLSHLQTKDYDYVLHLKDKDCLVYSYQDEILQYHGRYSNIKECSILDIKDNRLIILALTVDGALKVLSFYFKDKTFTEYDLNVSKVNSACGFIKDNK